MSTNRIAELLERAQSLANSPSSSDDKDQNGLREYMSITWALKQHIMKGETTGDRITDIALVICQSVSKRIQGNFLRIEQQLLEHPGQFLLLVTRGEDHHHRGQLEPRDKDYYLVTEWWLGVTNGDRLITDLGAAEFYYPTSAYVTVRHYDPPKLVEGNLQANFFTTPNTRLDYPAGFHSDERSGRMHTQPPLNEFTIVVGDQAVREYFLLESTPMHHVHEQYAEMTRLLGRPDTIPVPTFANVGKVA